MGCGGSSKNYSEPQRTVIEIKKSPTNSSVSKVDCQSESKFNEPSTPKAVNYLIPETHNNSSAKVQTKTSPRKVKTSVCSKAITRWERGELIGRGAYGRVYKGRNLDTGKTIAIKTVLVFF